MVLLDCQYVTETNGSNYDSQMSPFAGVYLLLYSLFFYNVSAWEEVFLAAFRDNAAPYCFRATFGGWPFLTSSPLTSLSVMFFVST